MKLENIPQLLISLAFAVGLSFLYAKSKVDYLTHAENLVDIQEMIHLDALLDKKMLKLRTGDIKNFDSLVVLASRIKHQLKLLSYMTVDLGELPGSGFSNSLAFLYDTYDEKLRLLERFKQRISLIQLTTRSFPVSSRKFDVKLATHLLMSKSDRVFFRSRMRRLVNEVSFYLSGEGENASRIDTMTRVLLKDTYKLPVDVQAEYLQLLRYGSRLLTYTSILKELSNEIADVDSDESIIEFRSSYVDEFHNREENASNYRTAMFITAIGLLIYLLNLFLRLRLTTSDLNNTLRRLEFQNFAIDEHAIVSITDINGDIVYANDKFCEISMYTQDELIGQNHRINKSSYHTDAFFKNMWRTIAKGKIWQGVICNINKNGEEYWVDATLLPHLNDQGKPDQYISIRTDITSRILAEKDVALLARFPEENPEPVLRFDHLGALLFANYAAQSLLPYWGVLTSSVSQEGNRADISKVLETNKKIDSEIHIDGCDFIMTYTPVSGENYVNVYGHDVTARKQAEEALLFQANHDPLTGLYNRHSFDRELDQTLTDSYNKRVSVLLYLDLDQFKVVNDTCGHVAGDELLRQLTTEIVNVTRDNDIVARLGGDEFGIILKHCPLARGVEVANKIHQVIRDYRFSWEDKSFDVGASMGLVAVDGSIGNKSDLLRIADVACYTAKDKGRDNIHIYNAEDEGTVEMQSEMHWASMIPTALTENRFLLMAQDIVPLDPDSGLHKHYEILVRMLDENGGIIPPGAFIPAAERYGLMPAIDHWVVRNVIETLVAAKHKYGKSPVEYVAINLSGESMNKLELLEYIGQQIEAHPFLSSALSFEVTETAAISNLSAAVHFINELKKLGCEFSLDDFGSGLSSFGYLKNLPVDYLKIDGAFVKDILDDPIDEAMVQAINKIGHVMNIHTIAEFVENEEIAERLRGIGVDFAQGFGIARPTPLDDVMLRDAQLVGAKAVG